MGIHLDSADGMEVSTFPACGTATPTAFGYNGGEFRHSAAAGEPDWDHSRISLQDGELSTEDCGVEARLERCVRRVTGG